MSQAKRSLSLFKALYTILAGLVLIVWIFATNINRNGEFVSGPTRAQADTPTSCVGCTGCMECSGCTSCGGCSTCSACDVCMSCSQCVSCDSCTGCGGCGCAGCGCEGGTDASDCDAI